MLPVGAWRLWIAAEGKATGYVDVHVRGDEGRIERQLELGAPSSLRGRVRMSAGELPPELRLRTRVDVPVSTTTGLGMDGGGGTTNQEVVCDAQGGFRFDALTPGRLLLSVASEGFAGEATVELAPGGTGAVELVVHPLD